MDALHTNFNWQFALVYLEDIVIFSPWSLLGLCDAIHRFVPNFARFVALLSKKLCNGQLQIFDGSAYDEKITLETLKARYV